MKNNYFSSKKSYAKNSDELFRKRLERNFRTSIGTLFFAGLSVSTLYGQTNPVPQQIPYTQNFSTLTGSAPFTYPEGWGGWKLAGNIYDEYLGEATADVALTKGTNATTAAGIFDFTEKLGFLNTTAGRTTPVLAVSTADRQQIRIKYDLNIQRVNSNRIMGVELQYRIGNTGQFRAVENSIITYEGTGTGINTTGVSSVQTFSMDLPLPTDVAFKENVQFRWVVARLQGGTGDNIGFSIDNVEVTGITDPCANNPLPYTLDFTGIAANALPDCTTIENLNNDTSHWKVITTSTNGFTAPLLRYAYHSSNAANDWFYTKGLALEAGVNYRIRYKLSTGGYDEKLKIAIGNEQNAEAMTNVIFDHGTFRQETAKDFEKFFTVPSTGNYYIGFNAYSLKNQLNINLDDIIVDVAPTCIPPTAVTVNDISTATANLSWTGSISSPANGYEYYLSTTATAPTATTAATGTTNTTTLALQGLQANTNYNLWVRAVCSATDKSEWTSAVNFTTALIPVAFPFNDDFSTSKWAIKNFASVNKFKIGTPSNTDITFGDGALFVSNSDTELTYTYSLTDSNKSNAYAYVDVTLPADITTAKVQFDWLAKGESSFDYGRFFIVPTTYEISATTDFSNAVTIANKYYEFANNTYQSNENYKKLINRPVANWTPTGSFLNNKTTYVDNTVDLAAHAGETVRLLFVWRNDGSGGSTPPLAIDNFSFDYTPQCLPPSNIAAVPQAKTADVTWTASISQPANGYEYYYSTSTTAPTTETVASGTSTTTSATISGLIPETTYHVWVRSVCSTTEKSDWTYTPYAFTTTISCPAPTAPISTSITEATATLGWTSTAENFEYVLSTTNTVPTATTDGTPVEGNTVTVTDLAPNTTYYWFVRANCGTEDGKSQWTASSTFTTAQIPAAFPYVDNFDQSQWVLVNGTQTNKFYVGTPTAANNITYANNKLFVSENGTTNTYATTGSSVYAYRDITLPADLTNAKISFDWIYKGEGGTGTLTPYDYGRFYIVPTSVLPAAGTNLGYVEEIPNAIYSLRNNTIPTDRRSYLLYNPAGSYSGAFEEIAHKYNDQIIDLSAYAGQTVRMVFFFRNDSGIYPPSLAIDNFEINYTASCIEPTALNASNTTFSTATLSWTGNNSSYQYVVSTSNEAPIENMEGISINASTVALENLAADTTYYWWVKANCEDSSSAWVAGSPFTTSKIPQSFPFEDTFDASNWTLVNGNQANKFVIGTPANSNITFDNNALFISNDNTANVYATDNTSATFAYVDVELPSDITTAQVNFDWFAKGESTFDFGRFFIVPTSYLPTAGTNITATGTITNQIIGSEKLNLATGTGDSFAVAKSTFLNDEIDLSAYAGQQVRLVFYWKNDSSVGTQPPLAIDNFYFGPVIDLATGDLTKGEFVYYPNPVQDELTLNAESTISSIEVYNLAGQAVNHVKVAQKAYKLDTTKLTAGVYMVKVVFENGTTKSVKIIKK